MKNVGLHFWETAWVRSAAVTLLLTLLLLCAGCRSGPDPSAFNTPPTDAYALSGGKITHFTPTPGLPSSPADKAMLLACRQLPITSHTARGAFLVVTAGQFGRVPINALVVGDKVLMLPGDFITMGMSHGLGFARPYRPGAVSLTPNSTAELAGAPNTEMVMEPGPGVGNVILIEDSKTALVGHKQMTLHDPVLSVETKDLVMNWADMLTLFKERDRQRHQPPFIRDVKIIYDLKDYHR